ncbi:cytochrome c oxidase accessory protein CcoG [Marinobacterium rhizophilum]|uniref:Cytochrome c oxidase accessory protein CcoG n=1 Tax=Marinobacterium rhizophilum TaxID=420402 RepID=A0ABY5HJL7_9GAMM|nr:cytochrome c oxidase accessory protein CcoG [Marinobacterium rhizophilum]UTW12149.1 cytochrome c oxidase accessory protein CcoG [Marinobacterium rhizophilum]
MEKIAVVQDCTPPFAQDGKFHVRLTEGRFQNWRRLSTWPLIALFFGLVWVQVDGQPWLLFSFEQHRIILFGKALSWHDLPLLAGLMIVGASLLFFLAVAWGRVWCGFACPQSIWTWLFIRIEQLTEGRANVRARKDSQPMGLSRLLRRITKHGLWLLLATATAVTFTGYFVPVREILASAMHWDMSPALWGWLLIMAALTYANAGLVREKICLHACPYSRFQGVMFDQDTRTVSYDASRGEPRAQRRNAGADSGDCVDCGLCVQVCPTGIDIRDGLQAACIDCAACIDACDEVMDTLKRPRGLVRFASQAQLAGQPSPLRRPLLACYGAVLLGSITAVGWGFTGTTDLLVDIRRDRGSLFTQLDEHRVCNSYRIKVEGFAKGQSLIALAVQGPGEFELFGPARIDLAENNAVWLPYRVCGRDIAASRTRLLFSFEGQGVSASQETTFLTRAL